MKFYHLIFLVMIALMIESCCDTKTVYYNSKFEKCKDTACIQCIDINTFK